MKTALKKRFDIANNFVLKTIASVDELADHDMIYIYHHLKVGSVVNLVAAGTDVKGNLRYQVSFKGFKLGYITLSPLVSMAYQNIETIEGQIVGIEKRKFLPVKGLDVSIQATKMRMVS